MPHDSDAIGTSPALTVPPKRVAIYLVAQDAVHSLAGVLDRIPATIRERAEEILVTDAGSRDDTYLVGVGYKAVSGFDKLTVIRAPQPGVGAAMKSAIDHCRERGYDVVVLLHADGKYAPEVIGTLIAPLDRGGVDAVFGSRFLGRAFLPAGMPRHKALAIRALGWLQERTLRLGLSEYHCGYMALSVPAIAALPYRENADDLTFNADLIAQLRLARLRIAEVPVPAYTGDETRGLRGVRYVGGVLRSLAQYWLHSRGLREHPKYAIEERYVYRHSPEASHQKILGLVEKDRQAILDVGCGAGHLSEALAVRGNRVVGVDSRRAPEVETRVGRFLQVDLDRDAIPWTGEPFSYVVLADVLEHLREPSALLAQCRKLLAKDGRLLVSVPNVAHWSVRLALLFGRFDYTARGILDRTHLRFYTFRTIRQELDAAGFRVERVETTPAPWGDLLPPGLGSRFGRLLERLEIWGARPWKSLFAYQFVLRAHRNDS
jgi:2-polyprenyl-3-methyl-5-hydroxy-6-metoxy-1,4-benzoquinol methylase